MSQRSTPPGTLAEAREWRPLLNGEYPAPGPTKYGPAVEKDGQMVRPILVHAPVKNTENEAPLVYHCPTGARVSKPCYGCPMGCKARQYEDRGWPEC